MDAERGKWSFPIRWLWPIACVITLAGYFAPWVDHPVSGLAVTGLDLAEYVKFLPAVRDGSLQVWRLGFYIPLLAVSLACSLLAYRPVYRYKLPLRLALLLAGVVVALNMLPPAWSPAVLATEEFRLQTLAIGICLAAIAFSPLLGLLPAGFTYVPVLLLSLLGAWLPASGFLRVLPGIEALYRRSLSPGWGLYVMVLGLAALVAACWQGLRIEIRMRDPHAAGAPWARRGARPPTHVKD